MTGRFLTGAGAAIAAVSVVTLIVYLAAAGFKLNDVVGVVGAVVGIAGLVIAVYGLVKTRRENTDRTGRSHQAGAMDLPTGTGDVHNELSGGTVYGQVNQGRDFFGTPSVPAVPPPDPDTLRPGVRRPKGKTSRGKDPARRAVEEWPPRG